MHACCMREGSEWCVRIDRGCDWGLGDGSYADLIGLSSLSLTRWRCCFTKGCETWKHCLKIPGFVALGTLPWNLLAPSSKTRLRY